MLRRRFRIGTYRLHKPSNQAVVTIQGRTHYLGTYGSPESRAEYDRLISEHVASSRNKHATGSTPCDLTVAELCLRYVEHAQRYYTKRGRPTSEIHSVRKTVKTLRQLYGHVLTEDFGPLALKTCREHWVAEGLTRGGVNRLARITKTIFRWAVENELVGPAVWQALSAVAGLKRGRTEAPEADPVRPVPDDVLRKTLEAVHPMFRAMIRVQLLTGMRPGELVQLRGADLDTSGPVWVFRPDRHKMEHESRTRTVFIGPEAQAELKPWFREKPSDYLFGSHQLHEFDLRNRPAPRPRTEWEKRNRKRRVFRDRYTVNGYHQAIRRACDRAEVEHWSPNQLRHNAGTKFRAQYGIEAARVILGHSNVGTTQIYAEADLQRAARIIGEVG
jgi:integrase